uniref:Uncharacterized protein n=1 Tax=Myotis myotis TaxID=51298 RepID=A0A7J7UPS9_MYOMY|nr:hypothetical protein mMyoMyo1_008695 [Myotis myotis]
MLAGVNIDTRYQALKAAAHQAELELQSIHNRREIVQDKDLTTEESEVLFAFNKGNESIRTTGSKAQVELLKKISDREVKLSPRDERQVEKEDASWSEESFRLLSPTPPGPPIFSGTTLPRNTSVETTPSGVLRESSPPGPRPITTPPPPSADTMPELEDLEPPPISIDHSLSSGI